MSTPPCRIAAGDDRAPVDLFHEACVALERLTRFQQACRRSYGMEHKLLRPYAPESNAKGDRFFALSLTNA